MSGRSISTSVREVARRDLFTVAVHPLRCSRVETMPVLNRVMIWRFKKEQSA
jgi:hypothetical protein